MTTLRISVDTSSLVTHSFFPADIRMSFVNVLCVARPPNTLCNVTMKNSCWQRRGVSDRLLCNGSLSAAENHFPAADNFEEKKLSSSSKHGSAQERIQEMVRNHVALVKGRNTSGRSRGGGVYNHKLSWDLNEAYDHCIELFAKDICSMLFGTSSNNLFSFSLSSIMKTGGHILGDGAQDHIKACSAVCVWIRRTDELVDGINSCLATPEVLDRWEQRLIDLYEGRPHDIYDAALSHTLSEFPINIQVTPISFTLCGFSRLFMPLKELIEGMRMDMSKTRYESFEELRLYTYYAAATLFIMWAQLFGISPDSKMSLESIYNGLVACGVTGQLTDILRDVMEDARMGRIYLPQDDLARAGVSEEDIFGEQFGSNEWRSFMKEQVEKARAYADESEKVFNELNPGCRWMFWSISLLDREFLDMMEANNYNSSIQTPLDASKIVPVLLTACVRSFAKDFDLFSLMK